MRALVLFLALLFALEAAAQGMPGRGRGGMPPRERDRPVTSAVAPTHPFSALERELPSLEMDLALQPPQLDAWRVFARDVRDIAEMDRTRRKHIMSLRESGERPPSAGTLISTLAEEDRLRSEATAELKRHFYQLYDALDDGQRRTIDRRVIQSQVEPLGR
jgi:hypothetical protein